MIMMEAREPELDGPRDAFRASVTLASRERGGSGTRRPAAPGRHRLMAPGPGLPRPPARAADGSRTQQG